MKRLKQNIHRLVAIMLLVCFCLSTSSAVYAEEDPADWEKRLASLRSQLSAWDGSRNITEGAYGYKIQLFSATKNMNFESGTNLMHIAQKK